MRLRILFGSCALIFGIVVATKSALSHLLPGAASSLGLADFDVLGFGLPFELMLIYLGWLAVSRKVPKGALASVALMGIATPVGLAALLFALQLFMGAPSNASGLGITLAFLFLTTIILTPLTMVVGGLVYALAKRKPKGNQLFHFFLYQIGFAVLLGSCWFLISDGLSATIAAILLGFSVYFLFIQPNPSHRLASICGFVMAALIFGFSLGHIQGLSAISLCGPFAVLSLVGSKNIHPGFRLLAFFCAVFAMIVWLSEVLFHLSFYSNEIVIFTPMIISGVISYRNLATLASGGNKWFKQAAIGLSLVFALFLEALVIDRALHYAGWSHSHWFLSTVLWICILWECTTIIYFASASPQDV